MEFEERRLLYRAEYDILTIDRRRALLEDAGRENGMEVIGFRRFERWGVYTYTAEFAMGEDRYVFVPGDEVTLGWSGDFKGIDSTTRSKIAMDLKARGCSDPEYVIRRIMTSERRVRIPPMLVQVVAGTFEGSYEDAVSQMSLPTSDEWEYLCGGGLNTLFQWGDAFDFRMGSEYYEDMSEGPHPLEEPNFFGIVIADDPFAVEAVREDEPTFRGGDLGGHITAGYGPVIGYISCSPHFIPIHAGPNGSVPAKFRVRRVFRLDGPSMGIEERAEESPDALVPTGPEGVFNDERPFPEDYVFCAAMAEDPDVPDSFKSRVRQLLRGLTYWIPSGEWTYEDLERELRSRADRIVSTQEETGYRMSPEAVASVRGTFLDIIGFYDIPVDPESFLVGDIWNPEGRSSEVTVEEIPEQCYDERLMRPGFDGLGMLDRISLMAKVAAQYGMRFQRVKTFSRWGRSTTTGLFERDGKEFVLVPGDRVVLGWEAPVDAIPQEDTDELMEFLTSVRGEGPSKADDPAVAIRGSMSSPREVTLGPMLVAVEAFPITDGCGGSGADVPGSLPTPDEWEYLCGGGCRTLFPWGDGIDRGMRLRHYDDGPYDLDAPNHFGIVISTDPFAPEIVGPDGTEACGGDGGSAIGGGAGRFAGYLSCSPHHRPTALSDLRSDGPVLCRTVVHIVGQVGAPANSGAVSPSVNRDGEERRLVDQCEIWHQDEEHRRIIEAIESLPESEKTPELVCILARAYNNLGGPDDHAPCLKAVELLESVRDSLGEDALWNYRLGYSYWMMDREPEALPYLRKAALLDPDDGDYRELLESCERMLALPMFRHCFRERAGLAWERFAEAMPEIERLLEHPDRGSVSEEIVDTVSGILSEAIDGIAFEIGTNGERYELFLSPEADRVRLFEICELLRRAPADIRERWDLRAGNRRNPGFELRTDAGGLVASDISVGIEPKGDFVSLTLHCPKLSGLMEDDEGMVWWAVSSIMERVLGEIPAMAALDGVRVVTDEPGDDAIPLPQLPSRLVEMGFNLEIDAEGYLSGSITYRPEPVEDSDADWRLDIYSGTSSCAPLVNGYLSMQNNAMDMLHRDGAVAGFLVYSLESFQGDDRAAEILGFRDRIENHITEHAGRDAVEFIGGATGLYYGYVDLIAWDLEAVIDAAKEFFLGTDVVHAGFHTFRRGPSSIMIVDRTEVDPPESPILGPDDIERFESYLGEADGMFGAMLSDLISTLVNGINDGKFSSRQAESDLEVALWYSYACINLGDYEHYWQATRWMPTSECNASGCGTWFYRYSCALMYCGRLEEAREYAERGTTEEPGYPWIWLQAAKLRAHFGDREGAMAAVAKGLELVPGDYEFETLAGEIAAGAGIERFEYHWIVPSSDARLQAGEDPGAEEKLRTVECIVTNPEGAERFRGMFAHEEGTWVEDNPYCSFFTEVRECRFQVLFRMNIAAISKMDGEWMEMFRTNMLEGVWTSYAKLKRRTDPTFKGEGTLDTVLVDRGPKVSLVYVLLNGRTFQVELDEEWSPADGSCGSEEPEETWLDRYLEAKDSLSCGIDLDSYFTQPLVSGTPVTVMDIGEVLFPSGRIVACDPLVSLEDADPFIQLVPPGRYPVRICVVPHERYGDRYACVKVELSDSVPVRYNLAMTGSEDLSEEPEDGEFFGFYVDAGMGCIVDEVTQKAFRRYWEARVAEDEGIDPYNDLFCEVLENSYAEHPEHQREGGDWALWTVPGTDLGIPIFASGWGDGCYPCYFGYGADGRVCGIYVLFIDIARDFNEGEGSE